MSGRDSRRVTQKQRFWLDHLVACAGTDQSLARYAATHDLERQQLYNWKTRLRKLGLLADVPEKASLQQRSPVQRRRRGEPGREPKTPVRFSEVRLLSSVDPGPSMRIRFPNGVILETLRPDSSLPDRDLLSYLAALS